MNRRGLLTWVGGLVAIALVGLIVNLALGNAPTLGLDNGGGVKLVISPAGDDPVSRDSLVYTRDAVRRELIRHRMVDASARLEGDDVVVDIPNVADQAEVVAGVAAPNRVQLRAFTGGCSAPEPVVETVPTTDAEAPSGSVETTAAAVTDASTAPESSTRPSGLRRSGADTTAAPGSAAPTESSVPAETTAPTTTVALLGPLGPGPVVETTMPADEFAPPLAPEDDREVTRPDVVGQECLVGPAFRLVSGIDGGAFDGQAAGQIFEPGSAVASALVDSGGVSYWMVDARLTGPGLAAYAATTSAGSNTAIAVLLDDVVVGSAQVSSGFVPQLLRMQTYNESAAQRLADGINRGAFGTPTQISVLSGLDASIGAGAWTATVVAAAVALVVIGALMITGYRRLGLVWAGAAVVWALLCWVGAAILSQVSGYAIGVGAALLLVGFFGVLTAGSVGYYERLREDVRHGRRLRNSAQRSFSAVWVRLFTFDVAVFAAGVLLMALSAESFRSFGAYMALAALAHALVMYGVVRPAVLLGTESGQLDPARLFPNAAAAAKVVNR